MELEAINLSQDILWEDFMRQCSIYSSLALWVYEYMDLLYLEHLMIWKASWKFPKILYSLTRLVPLVTLLVLLCLNSRRAGSGGLFSTWGAYVSLLIADLIFIVRTWVIWGKNRAIMIFLVVIVLASFAAEIGLLELSIKASSMVASFYDALFDNHHIRVARFSLFTLYSTVELCLVSFKAVQFSRHSKRLLGQRMPLQTVMHYDGTLYYFYTFAIAAFLLVVAAAFPVFSAVYVEPLTNITALAVFPLLSCRMVIRLHEQWDEAGSNSARSMSTATMNGDTIMFRQVEECSSLVEEREFAKPTDNIG